MEAIQEFAGKIGTYIINPILLLIFGAGVLVFIWGVAEYLYAMNIKGEKPDRAKDHMLWGMIGMFIMVAAMAIIKIISNSIGSDSLLPRNY